MHAVSQVDWSFADSPGPVTPNASGLARRVVVGRDSGAVHTELATVSLAPGGWLQRHVHSFEEALYVLAGELLLELDGRVHRLVQGDYALIPIGTWHALANDGSQANRLLSVNTPLRLGPDAGRRDTFSPAGRSISRRSRLGRSGRPSVRRTCAGWATTRARRPRPRRSGSTIRPAAGSRPAWTPRSSSTAGSA
jgi:putative monooxygenase